MKLLLRCERTEIVSRKYCPGAAKIVRNSLNGLNIDDGTETETVNFEEILNSR